MLFGHNFISMQRLYIDNENLNIRLLFIDNFLLVAES